MARLRFGVLGLLGASVSLALAFAQPAHAFCRASSCELGTDPNLTNDCPRDKHGCVTQGNPLHWADPCLQYAVQHDGSPKSKLTRQDFEKLVAQAFAAWEGVKCPGGGSPRFQAQFQGYVTCDQREAVCGGVDQNVNVMMLHDSKWPGTAGEIGLTTPTGGTQSGLVIDTDLELNSQDFEFAPDATGVDALDITQVLTHEIGHFLGLAHSDSRGAIMSADYASLQLSRELLTDDDIAAICTVYPPGAALDCPAPPPPAYDSCQVTSAPQPTCMISSTPQGSMTHDSDSGGDNTSRGCNVASSHAPRGTSSALAAALLLAFGGLRRRRPRNARA
jgi:MYXO-CTERM domain-containing protein